MTTRRPEAIREHLAQPRRPDPRVVALLEELGQVVAQLEDFRTDRDPPSWLEMLKAREAEITAELERLVVVDVPKEALT